MQQCCEARACRGTNGGLGTTACTSTLMLSAAVSVAVCTFGAMACQFHKELRETQKKQLFFFFFLKRLISHFYQIMPKNSRLSVVSSQMWMSPENCRDFTNCSWPRHCDAGMGHPNTWSCSMGAAGSCGVQHPVGMCP